MYPDGSKDPALESAGFSLLSDFLQSLGEQGGSIKFWIEKLSIDLAGKLDSGELGFRRHFPKFQAMQELLQEQLGGP